MIGFRSETWKSVSLHVSYKLIKRLPQYVSALLICSFRTFYGLPYITPRRTSLLVTNPIGFEFQTTDLAIFTRHARDKPRVPCLFYLCSIPCSKQLQLLGSYASFMAFLVNLVMGYLPPKPCSITIKNFMICFTVIMFGTPKASLVRLDKSAQNCCCS